MAKNNSDLFIICGEKSGDNYGSEIISYLLKKDKDLRIHCWGGDQMKKSGATVLEDYRNYNVMGFVEVLLNFITLYKKLQKCKSHILKYNPKMILLIDFPGFNLRIAKFAKENGFNVEYYIPPKVWAWNSRRAIYLKKNVNRIYSIIPFEKKFFRKFDCEVDYVGNPLIKKIDSHNKNNISSNGKNIISLLPGSRVSEIKKSLPIFNKLVNILKNKLFIICGVNNVPKELYNKINLNKNVKIFYDDSYKAIQSSESSIVMSGTASLEVALLNRPQIVVYKTSPITAFVGLSILKIKFISLVNLILNKPLVKELIQDKFNCNNLIKELKNIETESRKREFKNSYMELRSILGDKDATKNVSEKIYKSL